MTTTLDLTATEFRSLAKARLSPEPGYVPPGTAISPSDFDLNPSLRQDLIIEGGKKPLRAAAVLVPVIKRDELMVLLTLRPQTMPSHAGQISFPGGKVDDSDRDVVATALREAHEEIGLPTTVTETLGFLDPYETVTGFEVHPVVGLIEHEFEPVANPGEVAEVFEVPLSFLMDTANHLKHERVFEEQTRYFYAMPYGRHYIWGATAGMLRNMHQRLFLK
ncbi:MAG: CoA pyrophosphatase [Hyphomicrobiaceae bacterium]